MVVKSEPYQQIFGFFSGLFYGLFYLKGAPRVSLGYGPVKFGLLKLYGGVNFTTYVVRCI